MSRKSKAVQIKEAEAAKKIGDWQYDHLIYDRADWRDEVHGNETQLGYFDWVIHQLESN